MAIYRKKPPPFKRNRLDTKKKEFLRDIMNYVAKFKFASALGSGMGVIKVGKYDINIALIQRILERNYYTDSEALKLNKLREFYRDNILKYKSKEKPKEDTDDNQWDGWASYSKNRS